MSPPEDAEATDALRSTMRHVAQTVCVVSLVTPEGNRHAMTASSVTSVSLQPPSMLVCVNRDAVAHDPLLKQGASFCVNVLSDDMAGISDLCAGGATGEARFAQGQWRQESPGHPPFLADALANVFCQTDATLAYGTHLICVGRVTGVSLQPRGRSPLVYLDGAYTTVPVA